MDKRQLLSELQAVVDSGLPDVLKGGARCNAPLLVDWLVDTVFALEDSHPPELKGDSGFGSCTPAKAAQQHIDCVGNERTAGAAGSAGRPAGAAAAAQTPGDIQLVADIASKESMEQLQITVRQIQQTLHVVEATTFPDPVEAGWLQDVMRYEQQRRQTPLLPQQEVKQEPGPVKAEQLGCLETPGGSQQQQPSVGSSSQALTVHGSSKGAEQQAATAAALGGQLPAWVRCKVCKRTVLALRMALHQSNCAARRALADRQAASLAAKAASQGRPATPPISTTSGRSGAGTAAAAGGHRASSGGATAHKSKRGASNLNPNRARSPATSLNAGQAAAASAAAAAAAPAAGYVAGGVGGGLSTGYVCGTAAAAAAGGGGSGGRGLPIGPSGVGMGPLGPGVMVYGSGALNSTGAGGAAAAAGDMGKPPLPKPMLRNSAPSAGGTSSNSYGGYCPGQQQQQQAGVHALLNPGGANLAVGMQNPVLQAPGLNPAAAVGPGIMHHGHAPLTPARQHNLGAALENSPSHGLSASATPSQHQAQQHSGLTGAAAAAVPGGMGVPHHSSAADALGSVGAKKLKITMMSPGQGLGQHAAGGAVLGSSGLLGHPAAVPLGVKRPRSSIPLRRKRLRLDALARQWDLPAAAGSGGGGNNNKRPLSGSTHCPPAKLHASAAAAAAGGQPTKTPAGYASGSSKAGSSRDSSRATAATSKQAGGGKPAASRIRLRGQAAAAAKRAENTAVAAAAPAGRASSSGGGSAAASGHQQQQHGSSRQQAPGSNRPRRTSHKGSAKQSAHQQAQPQPQQQQQQQQQYPTRQQQKLQQQQQQQNHDAMLLDTDLGDIPDDILELGNDPLFAPFAGSLHTTNTNGHNPEQHHQQQQEGMSMAMGMTAQPSSHMASWMGQGPQQQDGQQHQQQQQLASGNGWMTHEHQQQVHQQQQQQPKLPSGFMPTPTMSVQAPGTTGTTAGTSSSMPGGWVPQQQHQQQLSPGISRPGLHSSGTLGSLNDWLPPVQQPAQQVQQQPVVTQQQQQPHMQQQQQQRQQMYQQQHVQHMQMMHMQQMQAMHAAALQQQHMHQVSGAMQRQGSSEPPKISPTNGMIPNVVPQPAAAGQAAFQPGAPQQQQQQQPHQQRAMAAWQQQQQQAAAMQRMGSGGLMSPPPMMPPAFPGLPMPPLGFPGFPGMVNPAAMAAGFAAAAAVTVQQQQQHQQQQQQGQGTQQQQQQQQQKQTLISTITQGAQVFLEQMPGAQTAAAAPVQPGAMNVPWGPLSPHGQAFFPGAAAPGGPLPMMQQQHLAPAAAAAAPGIGS